MPERNANLAQFHLFVSDLDAATFQVLKFSGIDRVSQPYRFDITLAAADHALDPDTVINRRASLFIYRNGEYYPYSGVVWRLCHVDSGSSGAIYSLRLVAALQLLECNTRSRVFQQQSVPEIVSAVLHECGLGDRLDMDLQGSYPTLEYVVQYRESDLNFVSRLLESRGIWYCFREPPLPPEQLDGTPLSETLLIRDGPGGFEPIGGVCDVAYRPSRGMVEQESDAARESIHQLGWVRALAPRQVLVKNRNYRAPETPLCAEATIAAGDVGSHYEYGGPFHDAAGAQAAAELLRRRGSSQQFLLQGQANCRAMRAGHRFELRDHERDAFNTAQVLLSVTHHGTHGSRAGSPPAYSCRFTALPGDAAADYAPPLRAFVPVIPGVITATVEADGGHYAHLDEQGRYKVRMPFDLSDSANAEASKFVRLAQPYSGAGYGMHFPAHEGAEMVLACVNGDPDRPLGIALAPDAATLPPVRGANNTQGILRSAGNNELLMEDSDGEQKTRLCSAAGNMVELDDGRRRALVQSTDKSALLLDDEHEQVSLIAADHRITLTYKDGAQAIEIRSAGGHVLRLDDKQQLLTVRTNKGHVIQMDDGGKTLSLSDCAGKSTITLDADDGLSLQSKGTISICASRDLTLKAANINISSSPGSIEAKASQDMRLSGMNVHAKAAAGDATLEGLNAALSATMKASVQGTVGVEIRSDVQTKVSGAMTELSGSAVTTVKGGVVMIN